MWSVVGFLLVSSLTRAATVDETTIDTSCRARAWVRAPDLKAGEVVQGDVKIKLSGSCDDVSSYTLGLRFAERSWVKTRRENVTLPVHPRELRREDVPVHSFHGDGIYDLGDHFNFWNNIYGVNQSIMDQYDSEMKNPDLWLVREEERIAFETRYPLSNDLEGNPGRDIVKSFALLVPSTSYPPLFDRTFGGGSVGGGDDAGAEHICIYFVDVAFSNGTHKEIEAGYTSFTSPPEIIGESMDGREPMSGFTTTRESVNVTATDLRAGERPETEDATSRDEFTLEIVFPDGRHLEQGSKSNITITSHQVGPGLQRPSGVQWFAFQVNQRRTWAAKHAADNKTAEKLHNGYGYQLELWPKADDKYDSPRIHDWDFNYPRFSQKGSIENGTTFSTDAVTVPIKVPRRAYPPFEMYYQNSVAELFINLEVRNVSEDASEPDLLVDDEEYDWTPTLREQFTYLRTEILRATVPITIYRKPEEHERPTPLVHYLSPEARAPIFVDPSSVAELKQLTIKDRDDLAPFAEPKFNSKEGGDVVKERYWAWRGRSSDIYYVANTWLRKVVPVVQKDDLGTDSLVHHEALVVQT